MHGTFEIRNKDSLDNRDAKMPPELVKAFYDLQVKSVLDIGCVLPETLITTEDGVEEIEKLKKGSRLIDGEVTDTFLRDYTGPLIYIKPQFLEEIGFTPEHPILIAAKRTKTRHRKYVRSVFKIQGFKQVRDLAVYSGWHSQYVVVPKMKEEKEISFEFPKPQSNNCKNLGKQKLDNVWAKIAGWYLAEGSPDKHGLTFSLGEEPEYAKEILSLAQEKGLNGDTRRHSNGIRVRVFSASLRDFFGENFGKGAKNKKLPSTFLFWRKDLLQDLIGTYMKGDGWDRQRLSKGFGCGSASKTLIKQIQLVLLKLGQVSSYFPHAMSERKIQGRTLKHSLNYHLFWTTDTKKKYVYDDENNYYFKVKKTFARLSYSGKVCNLRTTSEQYSLPFIVHNCGSGWLCDYLPPETRYLGFDANQTCIDNAEKLHPEGKFRCLTIQQFLAQEDVGQFDAAFLKCIFCTVNPNPTEDIIKILQKRILHYVFVYDTEREAGYWTKPFAEAGFHLVFCHLRQSSHVQIWRVKNE